MGLDAGTGAVLWTGNEGATIAGTSHAPRAGGEPPRGRSMSGTVAVRPEPSDEPGRAAGIDARTGDTRWSFGKNDLDGGCRKKSTGDAGGGPVVPVTIGCDEQDSSHQVFAGIDAASGEQRWQRPAGSQARLSLRNGLALPQDDGFEGHPELLGPDGKTVFRGAKGTSCACVLQRGGDADHVLLTYTNAKGHRVRTRVNGRTGGTKKLGNVDDQQLTGESNVPTIAGKRSYRLLSNPVTMPDEGVMPAAFAITELSTGRRTYATLPVPSNASGTARTPSVRWFGVRGDRLFVVRQRRAIKERGIATGPALLSSYRLDSTTAPTELGGVSPKDWPHPCSLLNGVPVHEKDAYPGQKLPVVGGKVTLPATECRAYLRKSFREVHVRVWWRAATERQAATLFDGLEPGVKPAGGEPEAGADDERRVTGADTSAQGGTWLRVGRTVVTVHTLADEPSSPYHGDGDRKQAVRAVVANLRKQP